MNFKEIIELVARDMSDVNIMICERLISKVSLVNKLIGHILSTGGKRIRPIIVLLISKILKYKRQHITIATLIEFIHMATLLHDDVVDHSDLRRGKVTSNIEFGNTASILVGDFIYTKAFQMMISLGSLKILSLISRAVNVIVEGELLQLTNCNNQNISIENYMQIIYRKTAKLFEVASQSSAILAGANACQEASLRNYGRYLGMSFQLVDDLLDYVADSKIFGKNIGGDLNEGRLTLPLLHAMKYSTSMESLLIKQAIGEGNSRDFLTVIVEVMHKYGSLEYTRECAKKESDKAIACLSAFKPSPYLSALKSLASIVVHRDV
ncbi:octaprenyl diphosphate synthase [Blochmannia endosymbiont of Camponotus (Colobopsis) obliquus]|uniref:octaprenyl diphosphate synthase n=1 Tax=Blochmannia endosymbiont of Camponotus (Colobopsis) obliquus TaxID=1505597 RepID=UPI00061A8559|nr:octaprenyl diphosphate synthase [Blochmannia endosymbiont of Camponotus (Colobopsis) obliquus]AKC60271.1 octaprenyl-diphosphate synthase [Blochmannia endosymbiont of Camponotus (Colobopsis) obliquus]